MYNQTFNACSYGGVGYGVDPQYYYQQQQQHQAQKQQQQMIAGIMGYYPPEAAAMFYNPYSYGGQLDQTAQQFASQQQQQQLDYQLTPALYLLNQQAELLQNSLAKQHSKRSTESATGNNTNKPQRKQRGPYKKRTNKTLSPTVSPAPEFVADAERLSSSDLSTSSNNNRSTGSIQPDHLSIHRDTTAIGGSLDQQTLRKRKSDSFLELDQEQQYKRNTQTLAQKQSIFRDVTLMAVSSCTTPPHATVVQC
uniref:Uncharacterized protein n=1 Tax=Anopheles maculatus TaxID=74869 RepID=A0A182SSN2_9DIPT